MCEICALAETFSVSSECIHAILGVNAQQWNLPHIISIREDNTHYTES